MCKNRIKGRFISFDVDNWNKAEHWKLPQKMSPSQLLSISNSGGNGNSDKVSVNSRLYYLYSSYSNFISSFDSLSGSDSSAANLNQNNNNNNQSK